MHMSANHSLQGTLRDKAAPLNSNIRERPLFFTVWGCLVLFSLVNSVM